MPKFRCEHCRQKITAPDTHIGKRVRCPRCKQVVVVVEPPPPEVLTPPTARPTPAPPIVPALEPVTTRMPAPPPPNVLTGKSEEDISSVFGQWVTTYGENSGAEEPVVQEHETERTWQHLPPIDEYRHGPSTGFAPEPVLEAPATPQFVVPPAEVIDQPVRRGARALNSANEVAELLKTLGPSPSPMPEAPSGVTPKSSRREVTAERPPTAAAVMGMISLTLGVIAIGISAIKQTSKFAVPVAATSVILAALAGVVAARFRSNRMGLGAAGATAAVAATLIAVLGALGLVPVGGQRTWGVLSAGMAPSIHIRTGASEGTRASEEYVPATSPLVAGGMEVRVDSARVVQPIVFDGDWRTIHPMLDKKFQITLELRNVGNANVNYRTWRRVEEEGDEPMLADSNGEGRQAINLATFVPVGAVTKPLVLKPGDRVKDILLFEPPNDCSLDLKLDLAGTNIDLPGTTLRILIPAGMIRIQDR